MPVVLLALACGIDNLANFRWVLDKVQAVQICGVDAPIGQRPFA